jgi:hypothetical protein
MSAPGEAHYKRKLTRRGVLVACAFAVVAATFGVALGGPQNAQQKQKAAPGATPLERTFRPHEEREYGIQLKVRNQMTDGAIETHAARLPSDRAARAADVWVSWQVVEQIASVDAEGTAEVRETLWHFKIEPAPDGDRDASDLQDMSLQRALRAKLEAWVAPAERALHYRETRSGQLLGLDVSSAPDLVEGAPPPVVTEWFVEALRSAVALPQGPIKFGGQWRQPLQIAWKGWSDIQAFESGEWLKPADTDSHNAISLLTSKQITARVNATAGTPAAGTAEATFHAESLATLSLWDGHTISATRSAVRDTAGWLVSVAGTEHPEVVHQRMVVQVEIRECAGGCSGQ